MIFSAPSGSEVDSGDESDETARAKLLESWKIKQDKRNKKKGNKLCGQKNAPKPAKKTKVGEPNRKTSMIRGYSDLRTASMHDQSKQIESTRMQKMKVLKHESVDGSGLEIEIAVNKDMRFQELKKKLSFATGISTSHLSLVVRGEQLTDIGPNVGISEFWSPEDIVAVFTEEMRDNAEDSMPHEVQEADDIQHFDEGTIR